MVQLWAIVTKNDAQHPIFKSSSYSRLLSSIESYLDAYLERNPSDYLLKVHEPSHDHFLSKAFYV